MHLARQSYDLVVVDGPPVANLADSAILADSYLSHYERSALLSNALATLRLGTVLTKDGTPEIRTCYLKLGRAGHTHVVA